MTPSRVVIFSNGIADLRRTHVVRRDAPAKLSIPVRQTHVADILASLNVFGDVRIAAPPSFRPVNENDGSLSLDTKSVLENLAEQLSGSRVRIEKPGATVEGTLVGLHGDPEGKANERVCVKSLVVLSADGFVRVPLREITSWRFLEPAVKDEIDKVLKRNFQRIKPNSTFVDLTISTELDETEAVVQYTIPAAAWKISYRLIRESEGGYLLHGFAVVDNNTDEDWTDVRLAVVTGEPITFSTDLAESKIPARRRMNVVRQSALGAVEIEEGVVMMVAGGAGGAAAEAPVAYAASPPDRAMRFSKSGGGYRDFDARIVMQSKSAAVDQADVREVGDFCVFEATEIVSIGSNRSAVVPVFQTTLGETTSVLHYNPKNHEERAFRTLRFRNEMGHGLERGVCTVFEEGTYSGSCILPSVVAGERVLLAHALESGVKIRKKYLRSKETVVGIRIFEGACHTKVVNEKTYKYDVENLKDESFELLLDYDDCLTSPRRKAVLIGDDGNEQLIDPIEELKGGVRYAPKLGPKEKLRMHVTETRVDTTVVEFLSGKPNQEDFKTGWLVEHLIATNGPLSGHQGLRDALAIQSELDAKKQEVSDAVGEGHRLAQRQERLRKNIEVGGLDEQTARWKVDLGIRGKPYPGDRRNDRTEAPGRRIRDSRPAAAGIAGTVGDMGNRIIGNPHFRLTAGNLTR
jgi:hypothetical protein